jgi:phage head maturation protease
MKNLTMPIEITASATESRTISGRIVTFDEPARASIGKTIFAQNSLQPKEVYLVVGHNRQSPTRVGRSIEMALSADGKGIDATFKVAETTAGNDILVLAAEKLVDGLSVEADIHDYTTLKDGTVKILSAELKAVAVVAEPAVSSARITSVAAEQLTDNEDSESTPDAEQTTNEGDEVDNTVTQADAVETVEAAQSVTAAATAVGGFKTKERLDTRPETFLFHQINASLRSSDSTDSLRYLEAAADTTDNAGLIKTPQLAKVINGLSSFVRPTIEAISSETMPTDGMTFEIPKITQAPLAGIVAEGDAFTEQDQNSAFLTVTKQKFTAQQKFSVELFTLSNPSYYTQVVRNMNAAMATKQDAYANSVLVSNATADTSTVATYPTATELLQFVARGASSVYENTIGLPNPFAVNMIGNTKQWANIIGLNDNGRPIYAASNPMNAGGQISTRARRGMVVDMDFFVTANTAAGTDTDGSLIIVNPDAYTWYEDPSMYQLRAESTADGSITLGLYSFGAVAVNIAAGAYKINKA